MVDEPLSVSDDPFDELFDERGRRRSVGVVPRVVAGLDAGDVPRDVPLETLSELMTSTAYVERDGLAAYAQEQPVEFSMPIGHVFKQAQLRCVRMFPAETMAARYENLKLEVEVDGKKKKVPIFKLWQTNPRRRQYSSVAYAYKSKLPPGVLNLATGWTVEPRPGDWSRMENHIVEIICGGNAAVAKWFLDFLADIFQNPDTKRPICIVMIGEPGTGKTKLLEWLRWLVGFGGLKLDRGGQLTGRFNTHLEGKLIIAVEETAFTSGPKEAAVMKDLISSPTLTIEKKYGGVCEVANVSRIFVATNSIHAYTVEYNDRRIGALQVSSRRARDHDYFSALDEQMANGGDAAMLYDLLNREITSNLNSPPRTEALAHQKLLSLDPLHQAMLRCVAAGAVRNRDETVVALPVGDETVKVEKARFNAAIEQMLAGPKPNAQALAEMRRSFGIANVRPGVETGTRERQFLLRSSEHMICALAKTLDISPGVIREAIGLDEPAMELDLGGAP